MTWTDFNIDWRQLFEEKWANLDRQMEAAGLDVLVVQDLPNVRYLTGYSAYLAISGSHSQIALYRRGSRRPHLVPPIYYAEFARSNFPWNEVHEVHSAGLYGWLADMLGDARCAGYAGLTYALGRTLTQTPNLTWLDSEYLLADLRSIKTALEIEVVRYAAGIAEAGMAAAINACRTGVREVEISAEAEQAMRRLGAEAHSIVMRGPNAALLQEVSTHATLRESELVLIDLGCWWQGYRAEYARTVVVGTATARQQSAYQAVYEALQAAQKRLAPGVTAHEIVGTVYAVMARAGFSDYPLNHPMGHGIGVVGGEFPLIEPNSTVEFQPGMIINLEPGVFIHEKAIGIRLENMLLITDDGCEPLTRTPFCESLLS